MKIIKQGKLRAEREYEATCNQCSCVFQFQEKEASLHSDPRDGDYVSIKCPCCSVVIMVAVKHTT